MNNPNIGGRGGQGPRPQVHQQQQNQYHQPQFQQYQQQQQQHSLSSPPPQNQSFNNLMDNPDDFLNPPLRRPNIPSDVPPDVLAAIIQNRDQGRPYDLSDADKEYAIELMRHHSLEENNGGAGDNNMYKRLPQQQQHHQQQPVTIHPVQYQPQTQAHPPRRYRDNYIPTALQQSGINPLQLAHMFANQRQQALQQLQQPIAPRHFLYQTPPPSQVQVPVQGNHLVMLNNPAAAAGVAPMNPNLFTRPPPSSSQMPISTPSTMISQVNIPNFNPNAREFVPTGPNQGASTSKEGEEIQSHIISVLVHLAENPAHLDVQCEALHQDLLHFLSFVVYQNTPREEAEATEIVRNKTLENIVDLIFEQSIIEYEKNFCFVAAKICQILSDNDLGFSTVYGRQRVPGVKSEVTFKKLVIKRGQENFSQCLFTLQDLTQMGENQFKADMLERTFGCLMVETELFMNFINSEVPTTKGSAIFFALAAAEIMNNMVAYLLSLNIYQEIDLKVVKRLFLGLKLAGWNLDNFPNSTAAALSNMKFIPLLKKEMDKLVPSIEALVTLMRNRLNGSTNNPQNSRFYMEKMIVILEDLIRLKREKNWNQPTADSVTDEVDSGSSTPRKSLELKAAPPTDSNNTATAAEEHKLSEIDDEELEAEFNKFMEQQEALLHPESDADSADIDDYDKFILSTETNIPTDDDTNTVFIDQENIEIQLAYEQFLETQK